MEQRIKQLKDKLQYFGTRDLLGMIGTHFLTFGNDAMDIAEQSDIFNKTELMSPQKQYTYLAGLLMSTNNNSNDVINEEHNKYQDLESDIQQITNKYTQNFMYLGITSPTETANPKIIERNFVSMQAFSSYFDTAILRYPEQTESLILRLYKPFERELSELTQLNIDDYLKFYHFVKDSFSNSLLEQKKATGSMMTFLDSFDIKNKGFDIEKEYKRLITGDNGRIQAEMISALDGLSTINVESIHNKFGEEKGNKLLTCFALKRQARDFMYYNSDNPFADKPLCWLEDERTIFIVHPQFLLSAIYNFITAILEKPKNKFADKYKSIKANIVEALFLEQLRKVFGDTATYHTSVCEERGTKEHDILIEYQNLIFIVEVKASKVREPFFNPEKSYTRIRDHFKSDTGIGGAYEQSIILKKFIDGKDRVTLYEEKTRPFCLENISTKKILPIVLTLGTLKI